MHVNVKLVKRLFTIISIALFFLIGILWFIPLIIIGVLLVLDYTKIYVKSGFSLEIPFDFGLFCVILLGYSGNPLMSFIIVPLLVLSRALLGFMKPTFLVKFPLLILMSYLAFLLQFLPFALLGGILIIVRYVLEIILEGILFQNFSITRIPMRVLSVILGYFLYGVLGGILLVLL